MKVGNNVSSGKELFYIFNKFVELFITSLHIELQVLGSKKVNVVIFAGISCTAAQESSPWFDL